MLLKLMHSNDRYTPLIADTHRHLEITAVLATALGKFIFMDWLEWRLPFIAIAITAWVVYALIRHRQAPGILKYWGFRTNDFKKVARMVLPFGFIAIATFFIVGFYLKTINLSWRVIPILILYPRWGTIQQFLVIGLVAGNMKDLKKSKWPDVSRSTAFSLRANTKCTPETDFLWRATNHPIPSRGGAPTSRGLPRATNMPPLRG